MWGSTPCRCSFSASAWEQLPAIGSIPRCRSITFRRSSILDSIFCSKSIQPILNINCERFRSIICRGVGSKLSGFIPGGTSTSTRKSSPTISETIPRKNRYEDRRPLVGGSGRTAAEKQPRYYQRKYGDFSKHRQIYLPANLLKLTTSARIVHIHIKDRSVCNITKLSCIEHICLRQNTKKSRIIPVL